MQQSPVAMRNEKLGRTVCEALKKHGFDAFWCATKEDARKKALELIREGSSVSWGGCASVEECGQILCEELFLPTGIWPEPTH